MKFLLIVTFTVILIAGVCSESPEELSKPVTTHKEKLRARLEFELENSKQNGIVSFCPRPLTPEEIILGNQKIELLIQCGNSTIDKFINQLDDNVNFNEQQSFVQFIRTYSSPACDVFADIFDCISPVVDFCLADHQKIFKNKIFGIVPLINQSICLHTGGLIADIFQLEDGAKCLATAYMGMDPFDFIESFESESTKLFGDAKVCQKINGLLQEFYVKVGECSVDVLPKIKDMFGYICERTPCVQYVQNFQCY